jgi:hypothetical protein
MILKQWLIIFGVVLVLVGGVAVVAHEAGKKTPALPTTTTSPNGQLPETGIGSATRPPSTASATSSSSSTATPTDGPTDPPSAGTNRPPRPITTPTPGGKPTPDTRVLVTINRSATSCGSLWVVPSTEATHYINGQEYGAIKVGTTATTVSIPNNSAANALAYVVDDAGYTCLIAYQYASTTTGTTMTFDAQTTVDAVAYPELSGATGYELSERIRRLRLLGTYPDLSTFVTDGIKQQSLQTLAVQPAYLAKVKAVTQDYDHSYPSQF